MPDQAEAQILVDPIANAYAKVWQAILDQQQALIDDPLNLAKRRRLREMQQAITADMRELNAMAKDWVETQLPKAYAIGGNTGIAEAGGTGSMTWNLVSQEAVERLATGLYDDLLQATKHVDDTAKALIRAIGKDAALQKLIQGKTAVQAGRQMQKLIEAKGIHAIRYANGARHGLAEYSQMAMRTVTGNAYNLGTLQGAAGEGVKFWQVFDGTGCGWEEHNSPNKANGRIVTMEEAQTYPLAHPNCRRAFGPRPDVTKKPKGQKPQRDLGQKQPTGQVFQPDINAPNRGFMRDAEAFDKGGYSGLPQVMSKADYDALPGPELHRGVMPAGTPASPISAAEIIEQYKSGQHFVGQGIFGNGTYFSDSIDDARKYASGEGGALFTAKIAPDARVINWNDRHSLGQSVDWSNFGQWAVEQGVDVIQVGNDVADGSGIFHVVLNRTKVVIAG